MLKFSLCLVCFLLVQEEPIISWQESKKLTWQDFKAKPHNNSNAVATTASGITFGFSIKEENERVSDFTTEVRANFYPYHSWYKKEFASSHVLDHEQLHFDITELHARKFGQRVENLSKSNNIKKQLKCLHRTIEMELQEMQHQYDSETNFSIQKTNQIKWQAFIASELHKLSNFK